MKPAVRRLLRTVVSPTAVRAPLRFLSRKGWLPQGLWRRLPVEVAFTVRYPPDIHFRYRPSTHDAIGRKLYWRGASAWEPETVSVYCRLALHARRVLDVGANTGFYSLIACAARADTRVTAFEPVPRIRARLDENVALNGFEDRCDVRECAVSDRVGTARFHVPAIPIPTSGSLHQEGFRGLDGEHIEVPLTTLDALLPDGGGPVDLVKIDVEGFEDAVLRGMEETLTRDQPLVLLECNPDGPVEALEAIVGALPHRLLHLVPGGPQPVDGFAGELSDVHRNFLLVPPGKEAWLG